MGGAPLETLQPAMSVTGLDEGEVDGIGLREVAQGTSTACTTTS